MVLSLPSLAGAKQEVTLELHKVSGDVYCLSGYGGNIAVLKTGGNDGLLVVDSQFEEGAEEVLKKIAAVSPKRIKFLVNTHYHGDHTGGTEIVGKNAVIIMHPNCKASLLRRQKAKGVEKEYLSRVKLCSKEMTIKLGEETVRLQHFGPGHSAGDLVVIFEKSKVLHTGDLFFHGTTPYIDVKDGSNTGNWVRTIETLCKEYPDYKIIPGHGKVTDTEQFLRFAGYLKYLRKEVAAAVKAGKTREQTMKSIDVKDFQWLQEYPEFSTKQTNIGWIYDEMTRE
jgi:glyoxylase-like metal-dependent hydrolase (beta-lactamase superfamily II)